MNGPRALAFDQSGNLYVANEFGNTVSKFAAASLGSPMAGGVVIRSSLGSRPMSLGGTNNAVSGINLTDAELAQIQTTATGMVTIGDSTQTGNITVETSNVAATAGASTVIVEEGNIILGGNSSLTAHVAGLGGLVKTGAGNVILSGTNTFSGGTQVQAGSLVVNSAAALPDGTSLTIGAGGVFAFDPSQAGAGASAVELAATAPDAAAATPIVAARSLATPAFPTRQPFSGPQVENLSHAQSPISPVASDTVFKSYHLPADQTILPADNSHPAHPWAWLATIESPSDSSDQNHKTTSTIEALDKVLARFGV